MEKMFLGNTKNGHEVYVIVNNSHMEAHKDVSNELLAEAIQKVDYNPHFWMGTIDLGRTIGKDACVEISEADDVRWVKRPGRDITSPVVFNKEPVDTSLLTIGICTDDDGKETVFTAFPGQKAPKEPNDPRLKDWERYESKLFWSTHALAV